MHIISVISNLLIDIEIEQMYFWPVSICQQVESSYYIAAQYKLRIL